MATVATCVWRLRPELVQALEGHLGIPDDSYANGSQVWLRGDGPGGMPIEWRLHPRPDFARPSAVISHELFPRVVAALAAGTPPPVDPAEAWSGLEAAPAYGDEVDEEVLVGLVTARLGQPPDASGQIDRDDLGRAWERSGGRLDVVEALVDILGRA
ncbi:MAG TPA: hypothetical protein VEW93_00730 [Acidimicrobiales bacterium]|nr:hypothetical protein [Acidimicrobiales bacterium]